MKVDKVKLEFKVKLKVVTILVGSYSWKVNVVGTNERKVQLVNAGIIIIRNRFLPKLQIIDGDIDSEKDFVTGAFL